MLKLQSDVLVIMAALDDMAIRRYIEGGNHNES